jgi:hypothetical protein
MKRLYLPLAIAALAACSDSNNTPEPLAEAPPPDPPPAPAPPNAVFQLDLVNLTLGQPLSPVAAIIHDDTVTVFQPGQAASVGLETLAEGGDNSVLLDEFEGRSEASTDGPIGPGASGSLELALEDDNTAGAFLSIVSMLVNTNDAFTGLNGVDLSAMSVGDTISRTGIAYDSGTEANSENAGTIPGPADGGEGFNSLRDDIADQVTMHGGVVTSDDGLARSVLNQTHRFDNPVVRFTVTRTQ